VEHLYFKFGDPSCIGWDHAEKQTVKVYVHSSCTNRIRHCNKYVKILKIQHQHMA